MIINHRLHDTFLTMMDQECVTHFTLMSPSTTALPLEYSQLFNLNLSLFELAALAAQRSPAEAEPIQQPSSSMVEPIDQVLVPVRTVKYFFEIVGSLAIVKYKFVLLIRTHPSAPVDLPLHRKITTSQLGMLLFCSPMKFNSHLDSVTISLFV